MMKLVLGDILPTGQPLWTSGPLTLHLVLLVLSALSPTGTGGSNDGDPAPGRSPGPPAIGYKSTGIIERLPFNASDWCSDQFAPAVIRHFNVTLHHPVFEVLSTLLPGLVYQVGVKMLEENTKDKEHLTGQILVSSTSSADRPFGSWTNSSAKIICSGGERWATITPDEPLGWSHDSDDFTNITFRLRYRLSSGEKLEESFSYRSSDGDCELRLRHTKGHLSSSDLPRRPPARPPAPCRFLLPPKPLTAPHSPRHKDGLLVELTRLNVPCAGGGFIQFTDADRPDAPDALNSPKRLCGKLEELSPADRKLYFPAPSDTFRPFLLVHGRPLFALGYHLVDHCYNVTFVAQNGSLVLSPVSNLLCHFRVHLPYGNRVLLRVQIGGERLISTTTTTQPSDGRGWDVDDASVGSWGNGGMIGEGEGEGGCNGLWVVVWDGGLTWSHCSKSGDPKRDIQVWSRENVVTIKIGVRMGNVGGEDGTEEAESAVEGEGFPLVKFWYHAEPVRELVGDCEFGEVSVKRFCISAVRVRLDWEKAESFCGKRGGHLASIRDENSQSLIDNLLLNSPDYRERNSYWIGASDKIHEGHFRWSDGFAFSYSNWFPGWSQQGFYNRQPNDDGFSQQDCVEIRRVFPHPSASRIIDGITSSYLWNDLDCRSTNFFLCERLESGESSEQSWNQECNKTITLTREHPKATVVSSGFPHQYPDNIRCETTVVAPASFRLVIDFEELVLEKEPLCSYDYLELLEYSWNESFVARRLCGDMSDKLKLLRYTSEGHKLKFLFVSDYSHHYGGFKAKVSIESAGLECSDERYQMFNNSCYLFVSYPKVTWDTANQICRGMKAELANVLNTEEESFITGNIRKSMEYTTSSAYWLGAHTDASGRWTWTDGAPMEYSAWMPGEEVEVELAARGEDSQCLAIRWVSSRTEKDQPASGLYWTTYNCKKTGGYVCKKGNQRSSLSLNKTVNGTEGHLTSPGFPGAYFHNLDYHVHLVGPAWTRMVITFTKVDLENQAECLYDFVELRSGGAEKAEMRLCGNKVTRKNRSHFVSQDNEAILRFHSDYSVAGMGFYANWKAVDVTGCPLQKLTAREGIISSPNYGDFLLPRLDCTTVILAPPGKRVWLKLVEVDLKGGGQEKAASLELDLGGHLRPFEPLEAESGLREGRFVSAGERMVVRLRTMDNPRGIGFRAVYRTVSSVVEEEIVDLTPESHGGMHHLNYPSQPPLEVDFVQHLVAPIGYIIYLELQEVTLSETGKNCPDGNGIIEVTDNYADTNGTWWFLCDATTQDYPYPTPPFAIASYLNSLHVRQRSTALGVRMNATVKVKADAGFKLKLLRAGEGATVESCRPNPCQNGGKCLSSEGRKTCQCAGHFTGMFCALTLCELEPCLFGQCEVTAGGFRCHCQPGYTGLSCDRKQSPCEENPCEGRGECVEKSDSFHCRCHAWWEGPRCERRMVHIPFKPLSERMLQEPFWLGLITVFVVLAVIGIVWCAKRHFPEKLEKLLAEEADRHSRSNVSGVIRPPSVREQMHATNAAVTVTNTASAANCPRTLFGRLGIRKSSLLSLTSPQRPDAATSRTFSLDDLLRPSPRRTPSPRKKSNNSSTKRNPAEKKQILQQLICPPTSQSSPPKVTLNEFIALKEAKKKRDSIDKTEWKETAFIIPTIKSDSKTDLSKLEKKVTFARLLSKVSAEMSSGSEAECSTITLKALSTPVSPALDRKSSHSISSNQGSDSLSSSEIAISGSGFNSMLDIPNCAKRPTRLSYKNAKNASADSILEMFRSFTTASSMTRRGPSTSTTPTTSPQDDREESSIVETPVSTTSGPADSPTAYSTTIEIPVMDVLTAQKTSNNFLQPPTILLEIPSGGTNKCLTPIREVPTPVPSPALTPVMPRAEHRTVSVDVDTSDEDKDCTDVSEVLIQVHRGEKDDLSATEDETSPEPQSRTMVIPLLTVQEPSPPSMSPPGSFPGSPPPYKDMQSFIFPAGGSPRRYSMGSEKPNSLDLPFPPPMITITCNVSEPESDTEPISPGPKNQTLNPTANSGGMTYLSPFSMCSRADRTASESNLSSSGYSSMASPGPSRCGSNNPLCLSELEDHQQSQSQPPSRRPLPLLRTPTDDVHQQNEVKHLRGRSDSETLSDDPLVESNDEGIGTDHLDEKIEDGEVKSARELEVFMGKDSGGQSVIDFSAVVVPNVSRVFKKCDNFECTAPPMPKSSLQLPTIVVQSDCCDKLLSPVSSRSESPLSDKGLGRFSPMFYGKTKCDHIIFTDSDGLYDFPSSDCPPPNNKSVQATTQAHRKSTGRRRERRTAHRITPSSKNSSPTKALNGLLEVPPKDAAGHRRKPSPKRRMRTQHPLSSSSSTESLNSGDGDSWREKTLRGSNEASAEDTAEEIFKILGEPQKEEISQQRKVVGFRTIGHQIRFLRRIEMSLRRKEKLASCHDSEDDGDNDDPSLSLLPGAMDPRKGAVGLLHSAVGSKRRGHKQRSVAILPPRMPSQQDAFSTTHDSRTEPFSPFNCDSL